jgi:hypothetical protein
MEKIKFTVLDREPNGYKTDDLVADIIKVGRLSEFQAKTFIENIEYARTLDYPERRETSSFLWDNIVRYISRLEGEYGHLYGKCDEVFDALIGMSNIQYYEMKRVRDAYFESTHNGYWLFQDRNRNYYSAFVGRNGVPLNRTWATVTKEGEADIPLFTKEYIEYQGCSYDGKIAYVHVL